MNFIPNLRLRTKEGELPGPRAGRGMLRILRVRKARSDAFSLVEVVMAIGITAFATFAIAGLIPLGLNSFRQTKNVGTASNIARQIFSQLQSTPFSEITNANTGSQTAWQLPAPKGSGAGLVQYYDDQGEELQGTGGSTGSGVPTGTLYEVNVAVRYAPFIKSTTSALQNNTNLVIIVIQVAFNPGHQALNSDQNSFLWTGNTTTGVPIQIFTYQTMVAGDPLAST